MNEDFDGSALRELLAPVVADRGRTAAPADAIVAAGRRRVVGRRVAVASGALALAAAVPLAATAIAAGPGKTRTTYADGRSFVSGTPTHAGRTPSGPAATPVPTHSTAPPAPTGGGTPETSSPPDDGGLPTSPVFLASGVIEGKHWSVSGFGRHHCLDLLISQDGQTMGAAEPFYTAYCLPGSAGDYAVYQFGGGIKGGTGILAVGLAPARVAKVVAQVTGVAAPITVDTVPAPGVPDAMLYFIPIPQLDTVHATYDGYDAKGRLVGSFTTWGTSGWISSAG